MLHQFAFPGRTTRSVRQNICLAANPHADYIKMLQLQGPVPHLLCNSPIVQQGFMEKVVLVVHVNVHLEPSDQPFEPNYTLPQSVQLSLHRVPSQLRVRKRLSDDGNDLWRRVRLRSLTKDRTPSVITGVHKNLKWAPCLPWRRRRHIVRMM